MQKLLFIILGLLSLVESTAQEQLFPIRLNSKWGFINNEGKVVIEPRYLAVGEFGENDYTHFAKHQALGIVSKNGKELLFKKVNSVKVLDNASIAIRRDTLWGIENFSQKTILPTKFSEITKDNFGNFKVRLGDSIGVRSPEGKTIISMRFKEVKRVLNDGFYTETRDSSFLFSKNGEMLFKGSIGSFNYSNWPSVIVSLDSSKYEIFNLFNDVKTTGLDKVKNLGESYFLTQKEGEWQVFNSQVGNIFNSSKAFTAKMVDQNFIKIYQDQLQGIIASNGKEIIPISFNEIELNESCFLVIKNDLTGIYGLNGKEHAKPVYDLVVAYSKNLFLLQKDKKMGLAKTDGKILFAPMFDALEIKEKIVRGISGKEMGFIELDNNYDVIDFYKFKNVKTVTLDANYPITPVESTTAVVNNNGWFFGNSTRKWGFRRPNGSIRHPPTFYQIKHFVQSGFTIAWDDKNSSENVAVLDGSYSQNKKCALAFTANGNYFLTPKYWHIFESELRKADCNYVRALKYDGKQQVIQRNGLVVKKAFDFIDTLEEGLARFNIGGKVSVVKNPKSRTNVYNQLEFKQQIGVDSNQYDQWTKANLKKNFIEVSYGKWGFISSEGTIVIDAQFDYVNQFHKGTSIVKKGTKWGVINTKGEYIIEPLFFRVDRIEHEGKLYFKVFKTEPRFGIIDSAGNIKIYPEYKKANNFNRGLLSIKTKKGWTFLDSNLMAIHSPVFDEVMPFNNNRSAVKLNGKWGFINRSGTVIIPCSYSKVLPFANNRAWVFNKGKWYLINKEGQQVSDKSYASPTRYKKNRCFAKVGSSGKYSLLDINGKALIRKKFEKPAAFNNYSIAVVSKKNMLALIDTTGAFLTDFSLNRIDSFSCNWAHAVDEKGPLMLHYTGKQIRLNPDYYESTPFENGISRLKFDGKYGYIDTTGNTVIEFEFKKATTFQNGYAFVKNFKGDAYCINTKGEKVFNYQGKVMSGFKEGRAVVRKNGKSFYLDTLGRSVFDNGFKKALPFSENVGRVKIGKKWAVINEFGHVLNTPKYVKIRNFNCEHTVVKRSGSYGLFAENGDVVLAVIYDEMAMHHDKQFFVSVQDKIGHFDLEDQWIWEPVR